MKTSVNRTYKSILATAAHTSVRSMKQFERFDQFEMGFYFKDKVIGGGGLRRARSVNGETHRSLQTESVALNKGFRKKGHGIHLYHHLIAHAKACGAYRIYSSQHLNKHSRRMWAEKLSKFYTVVTVRNRKPCRTCGCNCKSRPAKCYYIQLKGK